MKALKSILAAVDLSETTPVVLRSADALAAAATARLHLVHAVELELEGVPTAPRFQALFERAERTLDKISARELREVGPSSRQVLLYSRHRIIAERAQQVKADLVVIGGHRHRGGLLGTTADHVLRTVRCPCWIARQNVRLPLGSVVLATDLSPAAHEALAAAATIVGSFGREQPRCEVVLLHIVNAPAESPVVKKSRRLLEEEAAWWVAQEGLAERIRVRSTIHRSGNTPQAILRFLRRRPPDLFVIGTHGRGALQRLLLGSVATRVLREVPCNAMAVPPARIARSGDSTVAAWTS
jgi:nucleotide-binding universal stress UspA family protein